MQLHLANTPDGYMLWGAFLRGTHSDGDGGIDIYHAWFMVARSRAEVESALGPTISAEAGRFMWGAKPTITIRPVSASELVICTRRPRGRLEPVALEGGSNPAFSITAALMDTRD